MNRLIDGACRLLEVLMALMLATMVVLVFGNAVLRYGFNSGITISEEVSRWLFIWITFLGAIVALREHAHLGVDMLVARLPVWGKKLCMLLSHSMMIYIVWLLFHGSLAQTRINMDVEAAVTGAPVAIVYASGVVFSVCAGLLLVMELILLLSGRMNDDQLVSIKESEDLVAAMATTSQDTHPQSDNKGAAP